MKRELLDRFAELAVAFDTETHLSQPGLLAPPLVCGSIAALMDATAHAIPGQAHPGISGELLDKEQTLEAFISLLEGDKIITGAFIAYDLLVMATYAARKGVDLLPRIFTKLERGEVYDILIGQALGAIADGTLGEDPRTGGDLRNPTTNEPTKYYSLAICTDLLLGRTDAKVNDEWRLKYALLEYVPLAEWPQSARDYPVDDVCNTVEDAFAQVGIVPRRAKHRWIERDGIGVCSRCSAEANSEAGLCWVTERFRNLHQMADQVYTAFAMHLGAAWGFNVNQKSVDKVEAAVLKQRALAAIPLIAEGLLKWKKDKGVLKLGHSKSKIARYVAEAQGAGGTCSACYGVGKVPSPSKKMPTKRAWDAEKDGINCKECCSTGFDLSGEHAVSLTEPSGMYPKGQISAGADTLYECGSDVLRSLAEYDEDAKTVTNYVPYLRKAQVIFTNPDGTTTSYSRPLTLRANVLLETDRVSYGDAIQQFPRAGGLRSCIEARKGFVLCSVDYNQGEIVTHAQSVLWILGKSKQAEMVLAGRELHSVFGAHILGVSYDEFFAKKKKNKTFTNTRQAAKPWLFGKPGGMGVAKLVLTQRRQGPDTPCANGPVTIEIEDANGDMIEVPGYRGLRFCILMEGALKCGGPGNMSREWGKEGYERPISPTCTKCLECAAGLENEYYKAFPEARGYFKFTGKVVEEGQWLTPEQCDALGMPPGSSTAPGEMVMHVSNMIRGGVMFNDCSNGYFQSLLAVAAKMAMRLAQRECCDRSVRVPTDQGSAYAGKVSPLLGSRCIVLQHDEIIAEIPEKNGHHGAMRLSEIMVRCLQIVCPDMAPAVKAPPCIMTAWYKDAEDIWVKAGTTVKAGPDDPEAVLIPWFPGIAKTLQTSSSGNGKST